MPKAVEIQKNITFSCDYCGKTDDEANAKEWYLFTIARKTGLILLEKIQEITHYESFHIPNKTEKTFCSLDCAKAFILQETDLFLAEIKPQHRSGNLKKL